MADTRDDDFDSANPFRSLNKRAFRDARTQKTAAPAPGTGTRATGQAKPANQAKTGGQGAHKGQQRPGTKNSTVDAQPLLTEEDAEAFLSAMGAVQRLDVSKKPGKTAPQGRKAMEQTTPSAPPAPASPTTSPLQADGAASPRPGGVQAARPAAPTSAIRAAERDKLSPGTAARLDADAARNGFALQDQPGFRQLLQQPADTPEDADTNAPAAPAPGETMPGKPDAVPVTASERKEVVRQRSRQAVAGHDHTPPPDEDNLFSKAMSGVRTLAGKGREVPPETAPREAAAPAVGHPLQDFMDGVVEFALEFTDEYLEGHVVGLDALTVGKLRAGQYSPEGHLDLHGMNALQAYEALIGFMRAAYHKGMRTVLVIPGRGRNSPDGMGVLREKVQAWLTHDPFKRVVLAFCTAQPAHGGAGALYVLLRKYKKSRGKIQWDRTPTDADLFL